jgi:anti-sigma factor RsiW
MKTDPCQFNRERLVDYADGQLSPPQAKRVTEHLQICPSCEQLLAALQQSITISQGLWQTGYDQAKSIAIPVHTHKHPRFMRKFIAAAACAVLAGAAWLMVHRYQAQSGPTVAQAKKEIQDAQHVASQLMVAQILASCEGTEEILKRHYQYLEDTYAETYSSLKHKSTDGSFKERNL